MLGARCDLLDALQRDPCLDVLAQYVDPQQNPSLRGLTALPFWQVLSGRERLLRGALSLVDESALAASLGDFLTNHRRHGAPAESPLPAPRPPAVVRRLPGRWPDLFERLAGSLGWLDPELCLAAETLAHVWGIDGGTPHPEFVVQTWILLADRMNVDGVVGHLTLDRIAGGCGAFYPSAIAHTFLPYDDEFRQALDNAWRKVLGSLPLVERTFDVRWHLRLEKEHSGEVHDAYTTPSEIDGRDVPWLPVILASKISGRSGEGAIACALRAIVNRQTLDPHVAITARFANPESSSAAFTAVGGIGLKLLSDKFAARWGKLRKLSEILVATDQPELDRDEANRSRPTRLAAGEVVAVPVLDLDDAYARICRWSRITEHVRRHLAEQAEKILDWCDPYIPSRLSREPRDGTPAPDRKKPKRIRLGPSERTKIALGNLPARSENRVVILADSGMGKSMLLVDFQARIARERPGVLPVRLGAGPLVIEGRDELSRLPLLSDISWSQATPQVLATLASRLFPREFLPSDVEALERDEWFAWLVNRGDVVFLLDAADQSQSELRDLAAFLQSAEIIDCPTIVTGRPEIRQTKGLLDTAAWDELWCDAFTRSQIALYLDHGGRQLSGQLMTTEAEKDEDKKSYIRKKQWAHLLPIPILLRQIMQLAQRGELNGLKNRFTVYARTIRDLVAHGLEKLRQSEHAAGRKGWSDERALRELRRVAWATIMSESEREVSGGRARFTGRLENEAFDKLIDKLPDGEALAEISLFTLGSLYERSGFRILAWRHLSFCEYLAGVELAQLDRQARRKLLSRHARDPRWRWIIRFALSSLEPAEEKIERAREQAQPLADLVEDLIAHGNPFVVYDAMRGDRGRLDRLNPDLAALVRWLSTR